MRSTEYHVCKRNISYNDNIYNLVDMILSIKVGAIYEPIYEYISLQITLKNVWKPAAEISNECVNLKKL